MEKIVSIRPSTTVGRRVPVDISKLLRHRVRCRELKGGHIANACQLEPSACRAFRGAKRAPAGSAAAGRRGTARNSTSKNSACVSRTLLMRRSAIAPRWMGECGWARGRAFLCFSSSFLNRGKQRTRAVSAQLTQKNGAPRAPRRCPPGVACGRPARGGARRAGGAGGRAHPCGRSFNGREAARPCRICRQGSV